MITKGKLVKLTYSMYVDGAEGAEEELMERATTDFPMVFIQGIGMMLPSFEQALEGKQAGEDFDFRIGCEDAYGEYDDEAVRELPKRMFEVDGVFDEERVFVGNIIPMNTADGNIARAMVVEVTADSVTIDLNHPLAGENLHFVGQILEERDATPEELQQALNPCSCGCQKTDCQDCGGGCGGC